MMLAFFGVCFLFVSSPPPSRLSPTAAKRKIEDLEERLAQKFVTKQVEDDEVRQTVKVSKGSGKLAGWDREAEVESFIVRRRKKDAPTLERRPPTTKGNVQKKKQRPAAAKEPAAIVPEGVSFAQFVETTAKTREETASFSDLVDFDTVEILASKFGARVPTDIQAALIEEMRGDGRGDVIAQSPTGSGKTLAYLLGAETEGEPGSVMVAVPSRELGAQVARVCESLGRSYVSCCGGANIRRQIENLKKKRPEIVVGTPGRLADLVLEKKLVKTGGIQYCIVDEADSNSDEDALQSIVAKLPPSARLVMVSATAEDLIERDGVLGERARAARLVARGDSPLAGNLAHGRILAQTNKNTEWKKGAASLDYLRRVLRASDPPVSAALVFVEDPDRADQLAQQLVDLNFDARPLSGDESDEDRAEAIRSLSLKKSNKRRRQRQDNGGGPPVVVATELAARGIDAPSVSHVVNYLSLPSTPSQYAHRAGRAGRSPDSAGFVVTIAPPADSRKIDVLQRDLGVTIHPLNPAQGSLLVIPPSSD